MFGKKLFGLLGLLYIGSQISSVSAVAGVCTATFSGGLKIDSDCDVGYYLKNYVGNGAPSDLSIECTDGAPCSLVYCSENNDDTLCEDKESFTGLVTYGLDGETILECSSGQCKVLTTAGINCSVSLAGGIVTGGLCITATDGSEVGFSYAVEGETYYYITVANGSTTSFTGPNTVEGNTKVLVKIGNGAAQLIERFVDSQTVYLAIDGNKEVAIHDNGVDRIVPKTDLDPVYEYCVTKNSVIMERMENHCSEETCEDYYTCNVNAECSVVDGRCPEPPSECDLHETEASNCVAGGYYLKGTSSGILASADKEAGKLYYCSSAVECGPATGVKIGYYKNADNVNAEAPQYILCSTDGSNSCNAVKVTKTDCNDGVVKVGDLVNNGGSIEICLATDAARGISMNNESTAISYFISVESVGNKVFGNKDDNYVKINLANNNILLNDKVSADRYVYTTDKHLIQVQKSSSAVCDSGKAIVEFKVNLCEDGVDPDTDPVNYYKISGSKTW